MDKKNDRGMETRVFVIIIWNWMIKKKNITIKTGIWREQPNRRISMSNRQKGRKSVWN
jgi:hypothetical protein